MIFLYSAGTNTSRSTSTGMLYFLSKYSEVRQAVSDDILKNLLGGRWENLTANPSMEVDWDKCEVVDKFFKEVQRKEGISDVLFYRTCTKTHKLGEITIKKGTIVNYSPYHLHHSTKYFEKPEEFDITRFEPENLKRIPRRAFMPFHEGSRGCAGIYLGQFMVKSVLLSVLS